MQPKKATRFAKISILGLTLLSDAKIKTKISSNFVTFSENYWFFLKMHEIVLKGECMYSAVKEHFLRP